MLKDNEIRQYGEYRTKRLVLDAWNKFGFDIKKIQQSYVGSH